MNAEYNISYVPVSNKRLVSLFVSLLGKVGDLLKAIAPDGIGDSPYASTVQHGYRRYHIHYTTGQLFFEPCSPAKEIARLSLSEFEAAFRPQPDDQVPLLLIYDALRRLFYNVEGLYDRYNGSYRCGDKELVRLFLKAVQQTHYRDLGITKQLLEDELPYPDKLLVPVYRFLFRQFRLLALDYDNRTLPEFSGPVYFCSVEPEDCQAILRELQRDPEDYPAEPETFESRFLANALNILPPPFIIAYCEVYGKLPRGYEG